MDVQLNSIIIEEKHKKIYLSVKKDVQDSSKLLKKTTEDCENRKKIYLLTNKSPVREKLIEMSETNSNIDEYSYKQFEKLDRATNNILDIESRGNLVSKELKNQTETMLRVNNNLEDMNEGLGTSSNLIKKMLRREQRNKLIIVVLSASLIFIFLTILAMRLFSEKNDSSSMNNSISENSQNTIQDANFNS